ncbi:hypothetical protein [Blastococcus brunescens]|uniref:Response regulatory domain-containing protein n=1 Tax=Blastococcus brunescens TaxID=1564165 RepID=A0ABZ1B9A7_9ACTN|nr:hypothetical protein [Blastococcus sp. BMG 8361]WRL66503.1 hypothetical protein U6N30_14460 [Blastococcus sp. BMG 8361]
MTTVVLADDEVLLRSALASLLPLEGTSRCWRRQPMARRRWRPP